MDKRGAFVLKNKKILAVISCAVMIFSAVLPVKAEVIYEQGLPAQEDSSEHLVEVLEPMSELPAFPGADGYAKYITGGRGGKVIHVTNLNTSGAGSFAAALDNNGNTDEPRIIVFDVSGTISLEGKVVYGKSIKNVTIAGQTAPGEGITLTDENFYLKNAENVIIRYIHFRHGQATAKDDSFYVQNSKNIMIDHCSFEYGSDESCSARNTSNLTIQWSIMTSGVRTHSMGGLQEWNSQTIHHCLLGNQNDRNPKVKGIMDFTNNVLYNWGEYAYVAGGNSGGNAWGNVVNNYFIAGLDTKVPEYAVVRGNGKYFLYLAGNLIDSNKNGVLDGVNTGIDMIEPAKSGTGYLDRATFGEETPVVLVKNRMDMPELSVIDSAETAYYKVVNYSGASIYHDTDGTTKVFHDDIDSEILNGVKNQTGKILLHNAESHNESGEHFTQDFIDNLPSYDVNDTESVWYRLDTDQDGMPDAWETKNGLDPNDASDRNGIAPSGYTWIEEYLNELAAPGFPEDSWSYAAEAAANEALSERTYKLRLVDYDGTTKEYEGIYGYNQIMVPFAPVAEYLGYNILEAAADTVSVEYPFTAASGLLNIDIRAGIHTLRAGDTGYGFADKASPNETVRSYNGMLYIPVNLISLGMGAVYEQTVEAGNVGVITVYDAEVYKAWHNDSGVRNERKVSGPSIVADVSDDGIKLLFDKEAALVASTDAKVKVTVGGVTYTADAASANIWGSHKVAAFKYSDFKADDSSSLTAITATATVNVDAGAFADYYNSSYVNEAAASAIDLEAEAAALAAKKATLGPVTEDGSGEDGTGEPAEGTKLTLREALQALYRLVTMMDINATDYDIIDTGESEPEDSEDDEDERNRDIVESRWQKRPGWQMVNGEWYYFDENGSLKLGWVQDTDGRWYYMNNNGSMAKGWVKSSASGLWYYLDQTNGDMLINRWLCDPESGRWYYLDENGAMCTGWIIVDNVWYLLDRNGAMCTGWNLVNELWYLLGSNGAMLTGWQEIGGKYYYMNANGECLMNTTTPDGHRVDANGCRIN